MVDGATPMITEMSVFLGDPKLLLTLEQGYGLKLSWEAPKVIIVNSLQKGDDAGLSVLGELVSGTVTVANFSRWEVVLEVVHH